MTKTMRTRSIVAAVVAPLLLAVGALVLVADDEPRLQKLSVGAGPGAASPSAVRNSEAGDSAMSPGIAFAPAQYVLVGDLPALPDRAPAYRYARQDGAAAAARVASALGLKGPAGPGSTGDRTEVQPPAAAGADGRGVRTGQAERYEQSWEVRDGNLILVMSDLPGLPWYLSECFVTPESDIATSAEDGNAFGGCVTGAVSEPAQDQATSSSGVEIIAPEGFTGEGGLSGPGVTCPAKELPDGSVVDCGFAQPGDSAPGKPVEPATPPEPVRPEGLPDQAAAEAIARSTLDRLGVATRDLHVEDGFSSWYAWAPLRVGDFEIQMSTSISIGVNGRVIGGSGIAATPEHLGDYPLVSVQAGFERLQASRFVGMGGGGAASTSVAVDARGTPATLVAPAVPPPSAVPPFADVPSAASSVSSAPLVKGPEPTLGAADPAAPIVGEAERRPGCVPEPGLDPSLIHCDAQIPEPNFEPQVIEVTGAHIVLVQVDDTLVPAYVFETTPDFGGVTPPVPAVVEELLLG